MTLTLKSSAFDENEDIPAKYTCIGDDVSPPLTWQGIPEKTQSLVLIVDDPDAPDPAAPKMTWVHWILYNIPAASDGLTEAIEDNALPKGTLQGRNDWNKLFYKGPCPPIGRHRYEHKLYALDTVLPDLHGPNKAMIEAAMQGHVIEQTNLTGRFTKAG